MTAAMNEYGLSEKTMGNIYRILKRYPEVEKAVIYGSRAMGNYREGSDIDMTLLGSGLSYDILGKILGDLDDSSIPYLFDVSIYDRLKSDSLRDHINRRGKVLYDRNQDY